MNAFFDGAKRLFRQVAEQALDTALRSGRSGRTAPVRERRRKDQDSSERREPRSGPAGRDRGERPTSPLGAYPGDFTGTPDIVYSPELDGDADPGEIVWTWVPYEEDHTQGKDRPVLIIGHDGTWLLGLQVTSKDHDRDKAQEARAGRHWMDIGAGDWDSKGRPSEVRVNRIVRIDPAGIRRMGAILDQGVFEQVAREVRRRYQQGRHR